MKTKQSFLLIKKLWTHIKKQRRRDFIILFLLMIFSSFAEIISISAVLPFIAALTNPQKVFENELIAPLLSIIDIEKPSQLPLVLTIMFGLAALFSGVLRLILLWTTTRLAFATGADIGIDIYRRTLYQPYSVHCSRNSSEIIAGISVKANAVIVGIIYPILNFLSSILLLIFIITTLLYINPKISIIAFLGFSFIYISIIKLTKKQGQINSQSIAVDSVQVIKSLQEGLGGIRDVLINGSQEKYCQIYKQADLRLRRAQGLNVFISASPRYGVEAIGMILLAFLALFQSNRNNDLGSAMPILGALALGAQRLLPALQQLYAAWSSIRSNIYTLQDVINLLNQEISKNYNETDIRPLEFKNNIKINDVEFKYEENSPYIIKKINFEIFKGTKVGIIGETGSGKTTLVDIIIGLLEPSKGSLEVDGQMINSSNIRSWQMNIAHVPQYIYLSDSTIEENIAFGVPKDKIDPIRVRKAAQQAQIYTSIEEFPLKFHTLVGENGVLLSGGQRQRIGIARALYNQAKIIIFDEATSALDSETEKAVMDSIDSLSNDLTIIIIAHRITTLKKCNKIVELSDGKIKSIREFIELRENQYL